MLTFGYCSTTWLTACPARSTIACRSRRRAFPVALFVTCDVTCDVNSSSWRRAKDSASCLDGLAGEATPDDPHARKATLETSRRQVLVLSGVTPSFTPSGLVILAGRFACGPTWAEFGSEVLHALFPGSDREVDPATSRGDSCICHGSDSPPAFPVEANKEEWCHACRDCGRDDNSSVKCVGNDRTLNRGLGARGQD